MYVQETTENGKQSSSTLMPALVLNQANTHTRIQDALEEMQYIYIQLQIVGFLGKLAEIKDRLLVALICQYFIDTHVRMLLFLHVI